MKILNLYSGIGGNRRLWGETHEITAVEYKPEIAEIYQDFFPNDKVIIADAHQYLLDHFKEFDFIWSSPPCPSHSDIRRMGVDIGRYKAIYPDMKLYEEIILLQNFFKGKYCVENVIGYYKPLIPPQKAGRHYFWSNFFINEIKIEPSNIKKGNVNEWQKKTGFILNKNVKDKRKLLRNCVNPELGLHILNEALREQKTLF